jgi:sulfate permease, SulP family
LGNMAGSFFQAMPAGGSLSRTGINVNGGARSRWAGIYSGIFLAAVLVLVGNYAELIPMTGLAALLIYIGFDIMIREGRELAVSWNISRVNTATAILTIFIGVVFDLTTAIFAGITFSLLAYAVVSSTAFTIVQMVKRPDGVWEDQPIPAIMPSNKATVIEIRGTIFFASVYRFEELLPTLEGTRNAVVILRVRDRTVESLTGVKWVTSWATKLQITGNKLMLADVEEKSFAKMADVGVFDEFDRENVFVTQTITHGSIETALAAAEAWIAEPKPEDSEDQP